MVALFGGPGSGRTTFLRLLVEASAGHVQVVILDPKGSPALADTVRAHGRQVWTLDGRLPAELLDPRPWQVPDLLLEAEDYSADARPYRDAAHQRALWAAWVLALDGAPLDLARIRRLLDGQTLANALEKHRDRDPRIADWLRRIEHQHGGIEDSGARGLARENTRRRRQHRTTSPSRKPTRPAYGKSIAGSNRSTTVYRSLGTRGVL